MVHIETMNASAADPMVPASPPQDQAGAGQSLLGRTLPARWMHRLLDRLDARFEHGRIEGYLPDGSVRIIGGRGTGPSASIELRCWSALLDLLLAGSVGWYQAWAAGKWHSDDVVALIAAFSVNRRRLGGMGRSRGPMWLGQRLWHLLHRNDRRGARRNIHAHYDLGNDFYATWLDDSLSYSSALFLADNPSERLEQAQLRKMDAILDRLNLGDGDRLLEIGCGWGAFGARAIERHRVGYDGLTISEEQARIAAARLGSHGRVHVRDYRDHRGSYDAIASIEMVEAVGQHYWPVYLDTIARLLKPGGRAAIQYIAIDDAIFDEYARSADFIQRYIFPGGCLISVSRFKALARERGLAWSAQYDFADDYAETLRRWRSAFDDAQRSGQLPARFDDAFCQLWRFYLMYCEAGFVGGSITVGQVTLLKADRHEGGV